MEFYYTKAGRTFFEVTLPRIAEELARLNRNLEALTEAAKPQADAPESVDRKDPAA